MSVMASLKGICGYIWQSGSWIHGSNPVILQPGSLWNCNDLYWIILCRQKSAGNDKDSEPTCWVCVFFPFDHFWDSQFYHVSSVEMNVSVADSPHLVTLATSTRAWSHTPTSTWPWKAKTGRKLLTNVNFRWLDQQPIWLLFCAHKKM